MLSSKFEKPSFEKLVTEQEAVQAEKMRGRSLKEYNLYIFPGQFEREPQSCRVTDLLGPLCADGDVSLEGVLKGLSDANERPPHWVDMCGGYGLPQRQVAANPEKYGKVRTTNVDLLDTGLEKFEPEVLSVLENREPGMTSEEAAPYVIRANAEEVELPELADVMTLIEGIQYLDNPLATLCNGYNQLVDDGLLIVAAQHKWPGRIHYQGWTGGDETPIAHLLQALDSAEITFAATDEIDFENGFRPRLYRDYLRTLVIQKRPGTRLVVNSPVERFFVNSNEYKRIYYQEPAAGSRPTIEVIFDQPREASPLTKYVLSSEVGLVR